MDLLRQLKFVLDRIAVVSNGECTRYKDIVSNSLRLSHALRRELNVKGSGPHGPRIAFAASPGTSYVEATLGTWLAGGIAVPLCLSHPEEELRYVINDSGASTVLSTSDVSGQISDIAKKQKLSHHVLDNDQRASESTSGHDDLLSEMNEAARDLKCRDGSLIIYTSGTTGKPKGALHTFGSLDAQISGLSSSWQWRREDRILHTLPLHHIHGIVNALLCPLAVGATIEFQPKFSPSGVWQALQRDGEDAVTVFMGVPTMYNYLLSSYDKMCKLEQESAKAAAQRLRLTVSGSAACPLPTMQRWTELSGQRLLERYGMTEAGMILSNPYNGERKPGMVGQPLPGVEVKLVKEGELAVRGGNLFKEYWGKPEATAKTFSSDGYFLTGDTATQDESGYWKILGRTSTDIIKSGGYKLSALQIEDVILEHPDVDECAVFGVPDKDLGENVTAILTCKSDMISLQELQRFAQTKLAAYQLPRQLKILDKMPRNAMGKINKKALRQKMFPDKA